MQKHFFQKLKQKTNYINRSIFDILLISARLYGYFSTPHVFLYCQSGTEPITLQRCTHAQLSARQSVETAQGWVNASHHAARAPVLPHSLTHSPRSRRLTSRDQTNGGRQIRALTRNLQQPLRCQPISWGAGGRRIATRTAKKGGLRGNNRRLLAGLSYF